MSDSAPLVVFSDDWGRHPSSCQHLIRHLLSRRRVTWVNTIGTRLPRLDSATAKRGFEKLRTWFQASGGRQTPEVSAPLILNPAMWPSFRSRFARGLNRRLLTRALRLAIADGPSPVVVTTLPLVSDLVDRLPAARWVYYCVDDYSTWPGLDGRTLQQMESELVAKVDVAIAVSETLQTHLAKFGKPAHLLTHGVDLDFWRSPVSDDKPALLRGVPGPVVLFWGVIDRRTDLQFVRALSDSMTEGTILLVGPWDNPDPALLRLPRVRVQPPVSFADLPALAGRAAVLIAPYADLPVTRAMQPLKLKEYLATGKPVVVRRLPATESWADCADIVDSPEAFARAVMIRLIRGLPEEQRLSRARLKSESWAAKAEQFEKWLNVPGTG